MNRLRLFETASPYKRLRRSPIRFQRHSLFRPAWTITLLGRRWSRTWGILPAGTKLDGGGYPDMLGGGSWRTKYTPRPMKWGQSTRVTPGPTMAFCKWRYR